jgi:hypothetical protein
VDIDPARGPFATHSGVSLVRRWKGNVSPVLCQLNVSPPPYSRLSRLCIFNNSPRFRFPLPLDDTFRDKDTRQANARSILVSGSIGHPLAHDFPSLKPRLFI